MSYHISDTHFNHKAIIEYCNRPFLSVEEMNDFMIKSWNSVIKDGSEDLVYFHGDFAMYSSKDTIESLVKRLNGRKILILGNHDRRGRRFFLDCGFIEVYKKTIQIGDYMLSHKPIEVLEEGFINIHGHIHDRVLEKYDKKRYINVSVEAINYKPIWIDLYIQAEKIKANEANEDGNTNINYCESKYFSKRDCSKNNRKYINRQLKIK